MEGKLESRHNASFLEGAHNREMYK